MADPEALDAYKTAKPLEPTWTVQGGDPLGAPLLRVWAHFARIQAGRIRPDVLNVIFEQLVAAARDHRAENEKETEELLIRASATEDLSWQMDAYLNGQIGAEEAETPDEKLPVTERLDLHDQRRYYVTRLNNSIAELVCMQEDLLPNWPDAPGQLQPILKDAIANLEFLRDWTRPARG